MSAPDHDRSTPAPARSRSNTAESDEELPTRYPGWNVLTKWTTPDWDEQTRAVVHHRLSEVPPIRFLSPDEAATLASVADRIVGQPDRPGEASRVPIVSWLDEKLHHDWRDGYRYEDLPPLREVWRLGLAG